MPDISKEEKVLPHSNLLTTYRLFGLQDEHYVFEINHRYEKVKMGLISWSLGNQGFCFYPNEDRIFTGGSLETISKWIYLLNSENWKEFIGDEN